MNDQNKIELHNQGYTILRNVVSDGWIKILDNFVQQSLISRNNKEIALHALVDNLNYFLFLNYLIDIGFIADIKQNYFRAPFILNSFSVLNNLKNNTNFSSVIHRDLRFYSGEFNIMLNCLVMVDDFTEENGGTHLYPYSHIRDMVPTSSSRREQAIGKKGDILLFNSNLYHAAAPNYTDNDRKAIPITFCRSFMKQLLDYPRAIGYNKKDQFSNQLQQLLGYHSRVPASLEEWNQPEDQRFYLKNQD